MCRPVLRTVLSVVATRVAVGSVPPLSLAFLRFGQGGMILLLFLLIRRPSLLRINLRDLPHLAFMGAVLFTIFPITFNVGLIRSDHRCLAGELAKKECAGVIT